MTILSTIYDSFNDFGFNRYAYCAYNPLKYVDPSGYRYYGYDEGAYYRMIDEMTRTIQREWHLVYESAMESAQLTISMACGLYSHGLDTPAMAAATMEAREVEDIVQILSTNV